MEVMPCVECGRLFNHIRGPRICPACQKKLEDKFTEVKKFVRENKDADIQTVSKEMEVSVKQIKRWIREERLVFSESSAVGLPCESCGATIRTGRYCDACKNKMTNGLKEAAGIGKKPEPQPKKKTTKENKMRFLDS